MVYAVSLSLDELNALIELVALGAPRFSSAEALYADALLTRMKNELAQQVEISAHSGASDAALPAERSGLGNTLKRDR
jgi:hypothetical protein